MKKNYSLRIKYLTIFESYYSKTHKFNVRSDDPDIPNSHLIPLLHMFS